MKFEHQTTVIPVDENLLKAVENMKAAGWMIMPGATPVAVYHLIRPVQEVNPLAALNVEGIMTIDETKVHIVRDGKVVS
jgi:hypothetical protein